tara:strand:+ start:196 stop:489 length:294 start_codon:yes stop_codon:yes gene_type:complete
MRWFFKKWVKPVPKVTSLRGTPRRRRGSETNVFLKERGNLSPVYDVDRMAKAIGKELPDIVLRSWSMDTVETLIKKSVLSRGRGKGSMSAEDWINKQ